jgi:hypothetical protein
MSAICPSGGVADNRSLGYDAGCMATYIDTDVTIISAGPCCLVFELGMLKLSAVLIDALSEVGGNARPLTPKSRSTTFRRIRRSMPARWSGSLSGRLHRSVRRACSAGV